MPTFEAYGSFEEMMEAERKAREVADSRVKDWQKEIRIGDVLVSVPYRDLIVFHEVLDNEKIVGENLKRYDDYESEAEYILDTYCFNPEPWNYRFCQSYSVACPLGELGDVHLSIVQGKLRYPKDLENLKANNFHVDDPIEIIR